MDNHGAGVTCPCVNKEADYHAECDHESPWFDLFSGHAVEHRHAADMALWTQRYGGSEEDGRNAWVAEPHKTQSDGPALPQEGQKQRYLKPEADRGHRIEDCSPGRGTVTKHTGNMGVTHGLG